MLDHYQRDFMCAQIAETQHGLITHAQALAAGHTRGSIDRRLNSKRWVRALPSVYLINGAPITWLTRCMALTLWDAGKVVISGTSGAALSRLDGFNRAGVIEASTCTGRRPRVPGVRLRRVKPHILEQSTLVDGIPTESLARVILNLCGTKHPRRGKALDQALREGKVTFDELWQLIQAEWTFRRRGIRILYEMVEERTPGLALTDSALEDMYASFVRSHELPRGIEQWPAVLPGYGQAYFDFGYPLDDSAVEINSYAYHLNDKAGFDRDAQKLRAARLAGIHVIPVTYSDLRWRPDQTAATLRKLLPNSMHATR